MIIFHLFFCCLCSASLCKMTGKRKHKLLGNNPNKSSMDTHTWNRGFQFLASGVKLCNRILTLICTLQLCLDHMFRKQKRCESKDRQMGKRADRQTQNKNTKKEIHPHLRPLLIMRSKRDNSRLYFWARA